MSTEAPFTPPRKKLSAQCYLCSLIVMLPSLLLFQQVAPSPAIVISPQTTYITEPLNADGLPDYEKYALKLCRGGVKPENNAAVVLWQAMWPGELDPADYEPFCRELGLSNIPPADLSLKPLYGDANLQRTLKWLKENGQADATADTVKALLDKARTRPWKEDAFPPLTAWVRENNSPLDIVIAATQRSQFYSPSPSLLNDVHEPLIEMLMPGPVMARDAARALAIRAMGDLGEGHIERAWRDILAIHRLARFIAEGNSIIEQAVATQIGRIACDATIALLARDNISADNSRKVQRDLQSLPVFSGQANSIDTFERVMYLDSVLSLKAGHADAWRKLLGLGDGIIKVTRLAADWNIALRRGNEFYDRTVVAARMPPGKARDMVVSKLNADRDQLEKDVHNRIKSIVSLNQQERGELFAELKIGLFAPDIEVVLKVQDGANLLLRLTRLAAALAVYRAEHGAYPEKLDELVPAVLDAVPTELDNGIPFIYKRDGEGYLLYSSGPNGADEHGSNEKLEIFEGRSLKDIQEVESQKLSSKIPAGADDISIHVPRPVFEMPKPTK